MQALASAETGAKTKETFVGKHPCQYFNEPFHAPDGLRLKHPDKRTSRTTIMTLGQFYSKPLSIVGVQKGRVTGDSFVLFSHKDEVVPGAHAMSVKLSSFVEEAWLPASLEAHLKREQTPGQ